MTTGAVPGSVPAGPVRAVAGAAVFTARRPRAWLLALAGFLGRGGVLVLGLPLLVLPTPTGISNALGGPLSSAVFGAPSRELLLLVVGAGLGAVALLVGGALLGAWAERAGVALALGRSFLPGAPGTGRVALVRLLGLVPVAVALAASGPGLAGAVYRELILPDELATPIVLRVLADVPGQVALVAGAWLLGDAAAALGVRRLLLDGRRVPSAWLLGWADLVRHPVRVLVAGVAGWAVALPLLLAGLAAASGAWVRLREAMLAAADPGAILAGLLALPAAWLGTLVLAGIAAAFRNAAWTREVAARG